MTAQAHQAASGLWLYVIVTRSSCMIVLPSKSTYLTESETRLRELLVAQFYGGLIMVKTRNDAELRDGETLPVCQCAAVCADFET